MKRLLLFLFCLLALFVMFESCATTKTPMPNDNIDEMLGEWINQENNIDVSGHHFAKMIFKPDNTADLYANATDDKPGYYFTQFEVEEKWMENDIYIYFDTIFNHALGSSFGLWRVNPKKNTLELMFTFRDYGIDFKFDTSAGFYDIPSYYIWYRL